MNKHIELVKKWLADNDSVSLEELEANKKSAYTAYYAARSAASVVTCSAAYANTFSAYWVKRYEELTNE